MKTRAWMLLAALLASSAFGQSTVQPNSQTAASLGLVTTAAMTLYVDTTGNDNNPCTATGTAACLTIQGAINKIPKTIAHPVVVNVAAGTYTYGADISGFTFRTAASLNGGSYILVDGTYPVMTGLTTGLATGTATGGTAGTSSAALPLFGTLVDAAATWTVDNLKGKMLHVLTGTGSNQRVIIDSNTATTITTVGFWTAPVAGSTYQVEDWGTIINGTADEQATISVTQTPATSPYLLAKSANAGGVFRGTGNSSQEGAAPTISIRGFKFTNTLGSVFAFRGEGQEQAWWNNYANGANTANLVTMLGGNAVTVGFSVFNRTGDGCDVAATDAPDRGWAINSVLFTNTVGSSMCGMPGSGFASATHFGGGGPTWIQFAGQWSSTRIQSSIISGTGTCITLSSWTSGGTGSVKHQLLIINTYMSCLTGVSAAVPSEIWLDTVGGVGNTTLMTLSRGAHGHISSNTTADGTCVLDSQAAPPTCVAIQSAPYLNAAGKIRYVNLDSGTSITELSP